MLYTPGRILWDEGRSAAGLLLRGSFLPSSGLLLLGGGEAQYIIETGISAIGNLTQNFISMATWTDALRTSSFPQNWTIFYWAY